MVSVWMDMRHDAPATVCLASKLDPYSSDAHVAGEDMSSEEQAAVGRCRTPRKSGFDIFHLSTSGAEALIIQPTKPLKRRPADVECNHVQTRTSV